MESNSNKKKISKPQMDAKERISQTNVKVPSSDTESGIKEYSSGAAAFADFFGTIAREIEYETQKIMDSPKYRFINSKLDKYPSESVVNSISELHEQLMNLGFDVEIIENIDIRDVSKERRYLIRVSSFNGIYIETDLLEYRENIKDLSFSAEDFFQKEIAKITGSIDEETKKVADLIVAVLSYMMYYRVMYTLKYNRIGWCKYDWDGKTYLFKYDKILTKMPFIKGCGNKKVVDGLSESVSPEGEKKWVDTAIKLLNNHIMDCVVMGASASGLIRGYLPYTKETNININIQGHPASGKSTICHFALSMFGNPEKLEGSFTDTDNSMEEIRVRRPVLPYILDERMLKNNGTEKSKSADLLTDVFREYEGKVKERLGKQYAENAGERTYGPIISSSVGKMMDIMLLEQAKDFGQYRRFMEFYVDNKVENQLFSDADEAKEVEQVAYKHYGFGVKIVVDYMLDLITYGYRDGDGSLLSGYEDNDLIMAEFSKLDSKISKRLQAEEEKEKNLNLTPSSKRLTMIVYSYQILRDALLYHNKLKNERKTKTYIEQQYNNAVLESAQSSEAEEFAKNILDYVSKACKSDIENNEVKVRIGKTRTQCNDEIALIISNIYQYDRREAQKKILNIIHGFHNQCIEGSCQNDNFSQNEIEACEKAIRGSFDKLYKRIVDDDEEIRRNIVLNITVNNKDDEENIIKDRTEEVIELLVNNLVEKMKVIKDREIPEYRIYDYFLKNKEKFYKCEYLNETWGDSNHCRYLGKYIERKNGIELILDNKLGTEKFLFSQTIPEPEQIFEYMQVKDKLNSIENPTDELKNMEKTLREAYHAVSNSEIDRYCRIHDIIRKKKNTTVRFFQGDNERRADSYLLSVSKESINEKKE